MRIRSPLGTSRCRIRCEHGARPHFCGLARQSQHQVLHRPGGRIEINANAELLRNGDYFVNARGSLIVPVNGDAVKMDDAWLQFGSSVWDLKMGRFEAADLFPVGMDTVVMPANAVGYRANALRGRVTDGRFHGALGFNAAPGLRFEVGMVAEKNDKTTPSGLRPSVVYQTGGLTLRAGLESIQRHDGGQDSTGVGLSVGYVLNKTTSLNLNYARDDKSDASSVGANAVFGGVVGQGALGLGWIQDKTGATKADTVYAAYKMPLFGVKNAFITPAISVSNGTLVDNVVAVRVRFNYAF